MNQKEIKIETKKYIANHFGSTLKNAADVFEMVETSPFLVSISSVRRYLKEMEAEGILIKEDGKYKLADKVVVETDDMLETTLQKVVDEVTEGRLLDVTLIDGNGAPLDQIRCVTLEDIQNLRKALLVFGTAVEEIHAAPLVTTKELIKSEETPVKKETQASNKKARYTRANALADAIRDCDKCPKDHLISKSNELYVQSGGKDNIKESRWYFNNSLILLVSLGTVVVENDLISICK